jgi:hypothetical protein
VFTGNTSKIISCFSSLSENLCFSRSLRLNGANVLFEKEKAAPESGFCNCYNDFTCSPSDWQALYRSVALIFPIWHQIRQDV